MRTSRSKFIFLVWLMVVADGSLAVSLKEVEEQRAGAQGSGARMQVSKRGGGSRRRTGISSPQ